MMEEGFPFARLILLTVQKTPSGNPIQFDPISPDHPLSGQFVVLPMGTNFRKRPQTQKQIGVIRFEAVLRRWSLAAEAVV